MDHSKIVFRLKHHQKLYDCKRFMELVDSLCIIIFEHNASTDNCGRSGLHYHGIIEHNGDDSAIVVLKMYCAYLRIEKCNSPEQYIKDLAKLGGKVMINSIWKSVNLSLYYAEAPIDEAIHLKPGHFEEEEYKRCCMELIMKSYIFGKGIFDPEEIWKQIKKENYYYWSIPEQLKTLIKKSIALAHQKILDQSILELCGNVLVHSSDYYSLKETVVLVEEWCRHQNINLEEFTMNLIKCFDKQVNYKNSLYLQGSSESGVFSIIDSIAEACILVGKIKEETTGYTYVWEDCLDKRCIIMQDPVFDEHMFENLGDILKGIGTLVPHQLSTTKYLRHTPVIIICSENDWENNFFLHRLQNSFLECYANLKPFLKLHNDARRLHPDWINVMYMLFTGNTNDNAESYFEDIPMIIDSSVESSDEEYDYTASVTSLPLKSSDEEYNSDASISSSVSSKND